MKLAFDGSDKSSSKNCHNWIWPLPPCDVVVGGSDAGFGELQLAVYSEENEWMEKLVTVQNKTLKKIRFSIIGKTRKEIGYFIWSIYFGHDAMVKKGVCFFFFLSWQ